MEASFSKNWVHKFINRYHSIKALYNRRYNYQRSKYEDLELLKVWFKSVNAVVAEYSINKDDIYNFDETGFQIGVIATAKVVTSANRARRPRTTQPGN